MDILLELFFFFNVVASVMCDQLKMELKWEPRGPSVPLKQQSTDSRAGRRPEPQHVVASLECY